MSSSTRDADFRKMASPWLDSELPENPNMNTDPRMALDTPNLQSTASPLLLLPQEIQHVIFKHLFSSFEIVTKSKRGIHSRHTRHTRHTRHNDRRSYYRNAYSNGNPLQLGWSPSPGPLSVLLVHSDLYARALEPMNNYTTRDVSRPLDLLRFDSYCQFELMDRIQSLPVREPQAIILIKHGGVFRNLKVVVTCFCLKISDRASAMDVDEVIDAVAADRLIGMTSSQTMSLASFKFQVWCQKDFKVVGETMFWHKFFELQVKVYGFCSSGEKELNFTAIVPKRGTGCLRTCPPKTVKGEARNRWLFDWGTINSFDCACFLIEGLRVIDHEKKYR